MLSRCIRINWLTITILVGCHYGSTDALQQSTSRVSRKDTCDDPDANINCCFLNMPDPLNDTVTIPLFDTAARKLMISGRLVSAGNIPVADAIIYIYHTDSKGLYSKNGAETGVQRWHGKHHGWCKTGADGSYKIITIRPSPYPNGNIPAHIHAAIKEKGKEPYYISDFVFADDKHVTTQYISSLRLPGGTGVVTLKDSSGYLVGKRAVLIDDK